MDNIKENSPSDEKRDCIDTQQRSGFPGAFEDQKEVIPSSPTQYLRGYDLNRMCHLLEEWYPKLERSRTANTFLLLGNTGAGKSTIVAYLLDNALQRKKNEQGMMSFGLKHPSSDQPEIGQHGDGCTFVPKIYPHPNKKNYSFCDLPGFFDNRSDEHRIVASILTESVIKLNVEKGCLGGIIVCTHAELVAQRGAPFVQLNQLLRKLFKNTEKVNKDALIFIINRAPEEFSEEDARTYLNAQRGALQAKVVEEKGYVNRIKKGLASNFSSEEASKGRKKEREVLCHRLEIITLLSEIPLIVIDDKRDLLDQTKKETLFKKLDKINKGIAYESFDFIGYAREREKFEEDLKKESIILASGLTEQALHAHNKEITEEHLGRLNKEIMRCHADEKTQEKSCVEEKENRDRLILEKQACVVSFQKEMGQKNAQVKVHQKKEERLRKELNGYNKEGPLVRRYGTSIQESLFCIFPYAYSLRYTLGYPFEQARVIDAGGNAIDANYLSNRDCNKEQGRYQVTYTSPFGSPGNARLVVHIKSNIFYADTIKQLNEEIAAEIEKKTQVASLIKAFKIQEEELKACVSKLEEGASQAFLLEATRTARKRAIEDKARYTSFRKKIALTLENIEKWIDYRKGIFECIRTLDHYLKLSSSSRVVQNLLTSWKAYKDQSPVIPVILDEKEVDKDLMSSISLGPMKDAVVLTGCGHSFDRVLILKHFSDNDCFCPVCRTPSDPKHLVKNYSLQGLIDKYVKPNLKEKQSNFLGDLSLEAFKQEEQELIDKLHVKEQEIADMQGRLYVVSDYIKNYRPPSTNKKSILTDQFATTKARKEKDNSTLSGAHVAYASEDDSECVCHNNGNK